MHPLYPEWKENDRIYELFACPTHEHDTEEPMIPKDVVQFWIRAIEWSVLGFECPKSIEDVPSDIEWKPPSFIAEVDKLPERFERDGATPSLATLQAVKSLMVQKGLLEAEFKASETWGKSDSLLNRSISWAKQLFDNSSLDRLVVISWVKAVSDAIFNHVKVSCSGFEQLFCLPVDDHAGCTYNDEDQMSFVTFCRSISHEDKLIQRFLQQVPAPELMFVALYLVLTGRAVISEAKFLKVSQQYKGWRATLRQWNLGAEADPFQLEEHKFLQLLHTARNIKTSMEKLEKKVEEQRQQALEYQRKRNEKLSLQYFRAYKQLSRILEQRNEGLLNIRQAIDKIKGLHQDQQLLRSYDLATQTLRSTRNRLGLNSIEDVENIMSDWKECMDEQRELDEALTGTMPTTSEEEQAELEKELAELVSREIGTVSSAESSGETQALNLQKLQAALPPAPTSRDTGTSKSIEKSKATSMISINET